MSSAYYRVRARADRALEAAEAVNLFMRIVLVFSEIDRYVIKATTVAWSK